MCDIHYIVYLCCYGCYVALEVVYVLLIPRNSRSCIMIDVNQLNVIADLRQASQLHVKASVMTGV